MEGRAESAGWQLARAVPWLLRLGSYHVGRSETVDHRQHECEKKDGRKDDREQSGAALVVCRAG